MSVCDGKYSKGNYDKGPKANIIKSKKDVIEGRNNNLITIGFWSKGEYFVPEFSSKEKLILKRLYASFLKIFSKYLTD